MKVRQTQEVVKEEILEHEEGRKKKTKQKGHKIGGIHRAILLFLSFQAICDDWSKNSNTIWYEQQRY